jgi:outer membrane lipoprotein-sorting protein
MRTLLTLTILLTCLANVARASVDDVLAKLHARGGDLKTMAADVTLATRDVDFDADRWDTRSGTLVLERKPDGDTRVRVTFTKRQVGNRTEEARRDYLIDGERLVDRDHAAKKQTTRIIRKPGEKLDLFKLGEGPFPLPIGQSPDDVKKEFDVAPAAPKTPAPGLTYVQLTPKPGRPIADKFSSVLIGVNADGWPVEVQTSDANATIETRATLANIRLNDAVNPSEFQLPVIDDSWDKIDAAN